MNKDELSKILAKHKLWLADSTDPNGARAVLSWSDLSGCDLSGCDLSGSDLSGCDLSWSVLSGCDLSGCDLSGSDLSGSDLSWSDLSWSDLSGCDLSWSDLSGCDLSWSDLSGCDLSGIKEDFFKVLTVAKQEVPGLYDALMRGKVDGSCYEGECACLVGTIANIRHEPYEALTIDLKPFSGRPIEKWFLAIRKGDTPDANPVAQITVEWMQEWAKDHQITLPEYKLVSSLEFPPAFEA